MAFDIANIDPRYVDVDLTVEGLRLGIPPGHRGAGPGALSRFAAYEDAVEIIPESEWQAKYEWKKANGGFADRLVTRVFNQKQEGSCVGNASTQGHEVKQARQFGKSKVTQLSQISLYQLIGRSPNSGADVSDALDEGSKTGIIPLDTPENRTRFGEVVMPPTGFYTKRPSGWQNVAKNFRYDETLVVKTEAGLITALFNDDPVIVGRQGHSICYLAPVFKDGRVSVMYVNSWSEDWGFAAGDFQGGFGLDSRSQIRMSADWAFAIRSVIVPDFDQIVTA